MVVVAMLLQAFAFAGLFGTLEAALEVLVFFGPSASMHSMLACGHV
jgi:hypothetical protein